MLCVSASPLAACSSRRKAGHVSALPRVTAAQSSHAAEEASAAPAELTRRGALSAAAAAVLLSACHAQPAFAAAVSLPAKVFVAGATGATGRRVVMQLRAAGVAVRAGARDVKKAQGLGLALSGAELVHADVTEGVDALVEAIGDADAVVCATGFTPSFNFGKDNAKAVDGVGTKALVDAAKRAGVKRFVLVTSLLTNAPAVGQAENSNYKFLNALGGILDEKRGAELYLQASGLNFTVIRPGGLSNDPPSVTGNVLTAKADTFLGLDTDPGRDVSRDSVAAVVVAALGDSAASGKIVEVVASPNAPQNPTSRWFTGL